MTTEEAAKLFAGVAIIAALSCAGLAMVLDFFNVLF